MARPTSSARRPLTRARILQAALRLVDRKGVEALSMRQLGGALGVEAMSIYHHVPNKAALIEGVTDLVLAEIDLSESDGAWQEDLRRAARSFRRALVAHPNVIPLLLSTPTLTGGARTSAEATLRILRRAGLRPRRAHQVFRILQAFVLGAASMLAARPSMDRVAEDLAALGPEMADFPLLRAALRDPEAIDPEADFELGIELLVQAIGSRFTGDRDQPGGGTSAK